MKIVILQFRIVEVLEVIYHEELYQMPLKNLGWQHQFVYSYEKSLEDHALL